MFFDRLKAINWHSPPMKPQIVSGLIWAFSILLAIGYAPFLAAQIEDPSTTMSEIRITSPIDGTIFKAPATILVKVEGTDVPNVGHVLRLYEGNTVLRTLVLDPLIPIRTTPVEFNFSDDWTNVKHRFEYRRPDGASSTSPSKAP